MFRPLPTSRIKQCCLKVMNQLTNRAVKKTSVIYVFCRIKVRLHFVLPSASHAPSTWWADVAAPQRKSSGNVSYRKSPISWHDAIPRRANTTTVDSFMLLQFQLRPSKELMESACNDHMKRGWCYRAVICMSYPNYFGSPKFVGSLMLLQTTFMIYL